MHRLALLFVAIALADVGFDSSPFLLKTDLSGPALDQIQFALCPLDHPDAGSGKCLRLSSCPYRDVDLEKAAAKVSDKTVRGELALATRASFQSKLPVQTFVSSLLELLPQIDGGRGCVLADPRVVREYLGGHTAGRSISPRKPGH